MGLLDVEIEEMCKLTKKKQSDYMLSIKIYLKYDITLPLNNINYQVNIVNNIATINLTLIFKNPLIPSFKLFTILQSTQKLALINLLR